MATGVPSSVDPNPDAYAQHVIVEINSRAGCWSATESLSKLRLIGTVTDTGSSIGSGSGPTTQSAACHDFHNFIDSSLSGTVQAQDITEPGHQPPAKVARWRRRPSPSQ